MRLVHHLAVDADNFSILGYTLSDQHSDDTSQVSPQLDQIDTGSPGQRDRSPGVETGKGAVGLQAAVGYGKRALVETMMGCYKTLIGSRLRARGFAVQQIGVAVLNCLLSLAQPHSARKQAKTA